MTLERAIIPQDRNDPPYIRRLVNSLIWVLSKLKYTETSITADYTISSLRETVFADASVAAIDVTLPPAADFNKYTSDVKKTDPSSNLVTIYGDSGETIDGYPSVAISVQNTNLTFLSTGTEWFIK